MAACLDVEGEQVTAGAKIINWPCHRTKWNQVNAQPFPRSPSYFQPAR
jgi:hypothetical protein